MAATGEPTIPPTTEPIPGAPMEPGITPMEEMPLPPPEKRITSGGAIAMIGGLLMILSVLLAWFSVSIGPISTGFNPFQLGDISSLTGGEFTLGTELMIYAIIALIMGILALVLVPARKPAVSGICGIIGLIIIILALYRVSSVSLSITDPVTNLTIFQGAGLGIYIGLVGAILAMIGGFVGHKQIW